MASSGSVNFTVNRDEIIKAALRKIGSLSRGVTAPAADIADGAQALNLIVKQWQGKADFAPGLKVWTRKRGYLFPALDTAEYTIGPNGTHATSSFRQTTLSAAEAAGQTALSLTSITGIADNDYLGVRLTDGSIHWSQVNGTPAAGVATIDDALASGAASGATVYTYTTKLLLPLSLISLRRRNTAGSESPLYVYRTVEEYEEGILDKTQSGTPTAALYERGITDGTLRFNYKISDTTDIYDLTFLRAVEDFDASTDTPDYPQEWYRALVYQLAKDLAPEKGKDWSDTNESNRVEALAIARHVDPENTNVCFEPERDE